MSQRQIIAAIAQLALMFAPLMLSRVPYQLDARRCISYMTTNKSQIAPDYRKLIGNRIFGCDDCLAVCPWNKFAKLANEQKLHPKHEPALWPLRDLIACMDDALFRKTFANMPVRRAGYERFMSNVLIAAGNASDEGLIPARDAILSSDLPLVRSMAVWALHASSDRDEMKRLYRKDSDEIVENEWKRALNH